MGHEAVPQARAATACAPPASSTCVTPALRAQYSTSGEMLPSGLGGVAITTVLHPAMPACSWRMSGIGCQLAALAPCLDPDDS